MAIYFAFVKKKTDLLNVFVCVSIWVDLCVPKA